MLLQNSWNSMCLILLQNMYDQMNNTTYLYLKYQFKKIWVIQINEKTQWKGMLLHKSCISIPYQFLLLKVVLNTITLTQYLFPYVPKIFFYLSLCWVVVVIEMFFLLIEKSVWSWYSFKYLCTGTYPYFQSKHDKCNFYVITCLFIGYFFVAKVLLWMSHFFEFLKFNVSNIIAKHVWSNE
jgi:hypothetical protein